MHDEFANPQTYAQAYKRWVVEARGSMREHERAFDEGVVPRDVAASWIAETICMMGLQPARCQCKNPEHGTAFAQSCGGPKAHAEERRLIVEAIRDAVSLETRRLVKERLEFNRAIREGGMEDQIATYGSHAKFLSRLIPVED